MINKQHLNLQFTIFGGQEKVLYDGELKTCLILSGNTASTSKQKRPVSSFKSGTGDGGRGTGDGGRGTGDGGLWTRGLVDAGTWDPGTLGHGDFGLGDAGTWDEGTRGHDKQTTPEFSIFNFRWSRESIV